MRLGIVGWPVAHSLSPAMHTAALAAVGLTGWTYEPIALEAPALAAFWSQLAGTGAGTRGGTVAWRGVNVTVPHKEAAFAAMDARSAVAQAIGAVNTVVVEPDGRLIGHNTDAPGFLAAVATVAPGGVAGRICTVLGAGGSARAIVHALANAGAAEVRLASRRQVSLPGATRLFGWSDAAVAGAELIVGCTPPGVVPPSLEHAADRALVVDLVYYEETPLLSAARRRGLQVQDGLEMLVCQGAESFALWTGCAAPVAAMRDAARRVAAERRKSQ